MIIESLDIRHFGKLSDFKATFDRGFNLIEGKAESGKTTLAAFIVYMLYGFPEEKTGFSERERRTPWEGTEASGSMTFSARGARYRVERTSETTERGWRDTYALYNLTTGMPEQGTASPGERFLGVSLASFSDTAFLCDVRRGGVMAENTGEAIENILFSGDERLSTERAQRVSVEKGRVTGLSIPADALSPDNTVFVEKDGVVQLRKVTPVLREEGCVLLCDSDGELTKGERVIVSTKQLFEGKVLE